MFAFVVSVGVRNLGGDVDTTLTTEGECVEAIGAMKESCGGDNTQGGQAVALAPDSKGQPTVSRFQPILYQEAYPNPSGAGSAVAAVTSNIPAAQAPGGGGNGPASSGSPKANPWKYQTQAPILITGYGETVDTLVNLSPTLTTSIYQLVKQGYTFEYGPAGQGTSVNKTTTTIVIDANHKGHPVRIFRAIVHEVGHATYTADKIAEPTTVSRPEFIRQGVESALKDEGEALMFEVDVYGEIRDNTGKEISVDLANSSAAQYVAISSKYSRPEDRDRARLAIGGVVGKAQPSGEQGNYNDYYARHFGNKYDAELLKAGGNAPAPGSPP